MRGVNAVASVRQPTRATPFCLCATAASVDSLALRGSQQTTLHFPSVLNVSLRRKLVSTLSDTINSKPHKLQQHDSNHSTDTAAPSM